MKGKRMQASASVDEYISAFPKDIQAILHGFRKAIRESAPKATETISYGMPAYRQNRTLVYFAAFKDHIGFFPTASGIAAFRKELSGYTTSKGTVRFPLDRPVPFGLVKRIVAFRVKEDSEKPKAGKR